MPGHYNDPTIYELIASQKMSDTSISQLNNATKNTYIEGNNVEFWSGVITVARALKESREYGGGLPIPEASKIQTVTVGDSASGEIKPENTEVFLLQGIDLDNCVAFLYDGSQVVPLTAELRMAEIYLTPTLWIVFNNASGSEQTPGIAYHRVGL